MNNLTILKRLNAQEKRLKLHEEYFNIISRQVTVVSVANIITLILLLLVVIKK